MRYKILLCALLTLGGPSAHANQAPEGWYIIGTGTSDQYSLQSKKYGGFTGNGVVIQSTVPGDHFYGIGQTISGKQYRGKKIQLSAYLQAEDVSGWSAIWMRIEAANAAKPLSVDNMQERPINGTKLWQQYTVVLYVPEEAYSISFGAFLSGKGMLSIDEFALEVVPDDTPVTSTSTQDKLKEHPTNMSF